MEKGSILVTARNTSASLHPFLGLSPPQAHSLVGSLKQLLTKLGRVSLAGKSFGTLSRKKVNDGLVVFGSDGR